MNTQLILDYMAEHKLTKKEFAKKCGISVRSLNSILQGKNVLLIRVVAVAKAMRMRLCELFRD